MSKYAALDALILAEISLAPASFGSLFAGPIRRECEAWERLKITGIQEPAGLLARRLQALRKAGKIRSTSKGWARQSSRCEHTIDMFENPASRHRPTTNGNR
ncbi:hypothetical protein [Burkholderia cenocepacia]|uniref:hypothetical protein n=1 Tax=Burkholderia cenocepacia TaxID=95486 RepID=UPI001B9A0FDA|nr:hypothetical protein [Burkholderia cenocepacia]MBR8137210.1 hypothetical protein [Burkholderia cenocepacia]